MIKSMTGYGRGEYQEEDRRFEVEIKTVNHRYCDIAPHLPRKLSSLETPLRNLIKQRLSRGRIEIFVQTNHSQTEPKLELDLAVARDYHLALKALQENLGIPGDIRLETMAAFREIFGRKEVEVDPEKEWAPLQVALEKALDALERMRRDEGLALRRDFLDRIQSVEEKMEEVGRRTPEVVESFRRRLAERVKDLAGGIEVDPGRLAQEVAFLAERSDITEEIVRTRSHLGQFREMLDQAEPVGRKLEFLLQEINREVNTTGSKSNDAAIARIIIEIKSELEKMREQVQNVE